MWLLEQRQTQHLIVLSPCNYSALLWGCIMAWSLPLSRSHSISPHSSLVLCDGGNHLLFARCRGLWCCVSFLMKEHLNSCYYCSPTSHNSSLSFLSVFVSPGLSGKTVVCCSLILYSICAGVFVCIPVRELEIELCNKRRAPPDRIAETSTSSTAALPKKRWLMLLKVQPFSRRNTENCVHLILKTLLMMIYEDKGGGCCGFDLLFLLHLFF